MQAKREQFIIATGTPVRIRLAAPNEKGTDTVPFLFSFNVVRRFVPVTESVLGFAQQNGRGAQR